MAQRLSPKDSTTVSETFLKTLPRIGNQRSSLVSSDDDSVTLNKLDFDGDKIYGRETEISELLGAFGRIKSQTADPPPPKFVLISGRSGTGKSMIAQQLRKPVRRGGGFFVSGKFDLQQRVEPYTAFIEAFTELVEAIQRKPDGMRSELVDKIQEAVGSEGRVITDMISNIEELIGIQDAIADSGGVEVRNRLHFLLRKFTRAVCSPAHPLVLVLDDLQWADAASFELLETIVTDKKNSSLLVIGTCRDNEVDSEHALSKSLESFELSKVVVRKISCGNLGVKAVHALITDALRAPDDSMTKVLADIVHRKTLGNAFFVVLFLKKLCDDELLTYNFGIMRWIWDDQQIQLTEVTDNIVDLMMDKIQKLPFERQFALQVAACLGQSFRVNTLVLVLESLEDKKFSMEDEWALQKRRSINDILQSSISNLDTSSSSDLVIEASIADAAHELLKALGREGLLESNSDGRSLEDAGYSFGHDQIQNAALNLIPERKRPELQLLIGRTLLEEAEDIRLSLAVDLCNCGASAISSDDEERRTLAEYNLLAGEKAMRNAAFIPAATYLDTGLIHLGPFGKEGKTETYKLGMKLSCTAAEAEYCNGNFDAMQEHLDDAIGKARTFDDKIRPYLTLILSCGVRGDYRERGIDTAFFVLDEMGLVKFPTKVSTWTVLSEILKTKRLLKRHTLESLSNLPVMDDDRRESAMRILDLLVTMTYYSRPAHLPLVILRMVQWSIHYGVCKYSPTAFATYAMVLCGKLGDLKGGFFCGEVALALMNRLKCKETMSRTMFLVYGFAHHWTTDAQLSIKPFLYGYRIGMETGDIEQAMYNLDIYGVASWSGSRELHLLEDETEEHCQQMAQYKQEAVSGVSLVRWQCLLNLLGRSDDPLVLTGKAMNQEDMVKSARESGNQLLEIVVDSYRLSLAYTFGDYELADELSNRTSGVGEEILVAHIFVPRHVFYVALTAFANARLRSKSRRKQLHRATLVMRKMQKWVRAGNVSCIHMVQLFEAELAVIKGRKERAKKMFTDSIASAARAGYVQDRALAHERAAIFFRSMGDEYWAAYHFGRSIECYDNWGAKAKVDQLVAKHANFIRDAPPSGSYTT